MPKLILALFLGLFSHTALAHNVVGGVYAIGPQIEGEVGFSNGDMAALGTPITVTDAQGNELAVLTTDSEGLFVYTATQKMEHRFFANLSSGHVLALSLSADELPDSLPGGHSSSVTTTVGDGSVAQAPNSFSGDQQALEQMIERAVAKQIIPLRKEIAEYKAKASLQDTMGGIGYIFGLCGIGIWWRQRQLDKQRKG